MKEDGTTSEKAAAGAVERVIEMPKSYAVLYVLAMVAIIVALDVLLLREHALVRLVVNIGIVLAFAVVYLVFLRNR